VQAQRCAQHAAAFHVYDQIGHILSPRESPVIPVVFHIVYQDSAENIPDQRIYSQMEILNRIFDLYDPRENKRIPEVFRNLGATPGIRFCLASRAPDGSFTTGILRVRTDRSDMGCRREFQRRSIMSANLGGSDIWDPSRYLNVFVGARDGCPKAESIFPWDADSETDGIMIDPEFVGVNPFNHPFHLGYTLVHEAGHYLGLLHPHNSLQTGGCDQDDGIDDTPPQDRNYFGCPTHPEFSCGQEAMFMNFMNLVDDDCMRLFTRGQADYMLRTLAEKRPGLMACGKIAGETQRLIIIQPSILEDQWILFPFNGGIWSGKMSLIDLKGRILTTESFTKVSQVVFPRNPLTLAPGLYLIRYESGDFRFSEKVLAY